MKTLTSPIVFLLLFVTLLSTAQITYQAAFPNIDFEFPVEIQSPTDGTDRMFIVEQRGRIKVFPRINNVGSADVDTFLDITDRVRFRDGQEVGLLGLAFHPEYETNGYFYSYYTTTSPVPNISVRMVLSRFTVDAVNPNFVDPDSELIIFQFDKNQNNSNHNGGKIAFGPDGYLYISIGDGGGGNDPEGNGQNKNTVFGSILRIDIDLDGNNPVEANPELPNGNYEIPSDNPFPGNVGNGLDEIYAYGIRNTWKFSFDDVTGRLWGADVGQGAFEEVNIIENGKNYGWSRYEANSIANSGVNITEPVVFPVHFYNRNQGDRSITGGYVYRGSEITSLSPDISSKYIFGDYVSGRVWVLDYNPSTGAASSTLLFNTSGQFVSSFGVDKNGELYFSDYGSNAQIYKLVDGTTAPSGTAVNGIGRWENLNQGIPNGMVQSVVTDTNGDVYHAGTFNQAGNITANNIAVWNESSGWRTLGTGSNGTINVLAIAPNGNLYAGGSFSEIGGVSANNIALWNGSNWSALGSGVDGTVAALVIDNNSNVYVGGVFETVNGNTVRNIALWSGGNWSALTDATTAVAGTNNEIRSLVLDSDGILYVGGNFDEAGNNTANRIATWNGINWGTLGTGTSGFVEAIAVTPTEVFIGGNFSIAGGQTVNRIARWNKNTASWSPLNNGVNNIVNTLIHDGSNLFVGGAFDTANIDTSNSIIVNNMARWNETDGWDALGTNTNVGVDIKINSMNFASDSNGVDKIFVGGNFSIAGAINSNNTAQWLSENILSIPDTTDQQTVYLYPNPTTGMVQLPDENDWVLIDNSGKILRKGRSAIIDISEYAVGMYFLKIDGKNSLKIIKR
ncbi:PQQ-dependent sugar dehydrogenase [Aquimarina sp. SS2-1]|uniref:PQQ-dependent sugar dehydrogenase n=1 Tax=Aquimarina besae TaxID=3342247 RepID=UPI00366EBDD0